MTGLITTPRPPPELVNRDPPTPHRFLREVVVPVPEHDISGDPVKDARDGQLQGANTGPPWRHHNALRHVLEDGLPPVAGGVEDLHRRRAPEARPIGAAECHGSLNGHELEPEDLGIPRQEAHEMAAGGAIARDDRREAKCDKLMAPFPSRSCPKLPVVCTLRGAAALWATEAPGQQHLLGRSHRSSAHTQP